MLEQIQKNSASGIKSTIKDRYFNSACATPAIVFPVLIKLENSHIKKMEREKPGEKNIMRICLQRLWGNSENRCRTA